MTLPATTPMPNEGFMSTSSATTPMVAHRLVLTVRHPARNGKDYLVLVDTDLLRRRKSTHLARHTVPHPMRSAMLETWATSRPTRKGMAREALVTHKSN